MQCPGSCCIFKIQQISDQYGLSTSFRVTLHIDDVNDNEPICTSPGTIAMPRGKLGRTELFQMGRVCSDPDFNYQNGISDYRLSNINEDYIGGKNISLLFQIIIKLYTFKRKITSQGISN